MYDELTARNALSSIVVPTSVDSIRLDPSSSSACEPYPKYPTMYINSSVYTYSTDKNCSVVIDIDEAWSYVYSWWFHENKFTITVVGGFDQTDEDSYFDKGSNTQVHGMFSTSEEEHFQQSCINKSVLEWETEVLFKHKCTELISLYEKARTKFMES